ncbi:hypothetical protein B0T16DRAFT_326771 [Cercophora newfieldiana]|uniref:Histone chaperone RTT106/FACT complex subunit SPT16-like middle domain-containing protein n=1 Tax=Cercophora newfieldiana TaxID=92897 RepID=A0AA39YBJ8_9PEZI|nr:hypothetical protein B0T16DRAFT_326771 [Cercophora newfieldiana]
MAAHLDAQTLNFVFGSRPDLLADIKREADTPDRIELFNNIASYVYERLSTTVDDGPASKRRRVDIAQPKANGSSSQANGVDAASDPVLLEIKDISVSVPQRKKYDLVFTKNFLYARVSGTSAPVQGIVYPWRDIEHAFFVPVPDKSQAQHNYVLLPRNSYLPTTKQSTTEQQPPPLEPLVFTVPATAPKPGSISGASAPAAEAVSDSYSTLFDWALTTSLHTAGNRKCQLVASDPKTFHSAARQAYRPNEKAVHVKAFRGSKDGYLFFLPTGILWAFKKPLVFLPLDRIVAVSYTSVLQRTFNIVVEFERDGGEAEEIEFGMLDQEDYGVIDESYVKRHGLADRSMADRRKAKRELAENAKKEAGTAEGGDGEEGDGMTELERAQKEAEQALQDEEDEDEEDYDPGSEGESEGSGTSDEEDEDGEGGEGYDEDEEDEEGDEDMHEA